MGGITPAELAAIGDRLEGFAADVFESLPRRDQRGRGECYLRGLLLDGRRKSIQPMAARRAACHLPDEVRHRPKWQLVLDLLDELAGWGLVPPVLVADCGYGEVGEFRWGLEGRQIDYVVEVRSDTSAYPEQARPTAAPSKGRGRRPRPRYHHQPASLAELAMAAGQQAWVELVCRCAGCWPSGPRASPNRPSTGWPTCPRPPRSWSWSGWPGRGGEWSRMTANAKARSGWTTSRGAPGRAGTTT